MSAILLDDELLHYEVLGRGRPILFFHGWVGSWRYWIPAMQATSMAFRTYALDLWGFGDSAKNQRLYTLEQQAGLIERFMDQMGMGRVALVGHGLGAVAATLFTRAHPEAVDRLMAISCPLEAGMVSQRLRGAAAGELTDWLLGRGPIDVTEAARTDAPKADPQAIQASLKLLPGLNFKEFTYGVFTPRLLVHGLNDPAIEAPRIEQYADLPEGTHQVVFDQSGHFPMLDEGSKFNRLLADFLNLPSGDTPRQLQLKEEWKRRVR
ncbi:MAG TPA: alpha/beta hydrolase [Anaerolineaceae bacterium]|nr:alpha/beta hydrolase [Anaerolineaceae bacterium]